MFLRPTLNTESTEFKSSVCVALMNNRKNHSLFFIFFIRKYLILLGLIYTGFPYRLFISTPLLYFEESFSIGSFSGGSKTISISKLKQIPALLFYPHMYVLIHLANNRHNLGFLCINNVNIKAKLTSFIF